MYQIGGKCSITKVLRWYVGKAASEPLVYHKSPLKKCTYTHILKTAKPIFMKLNYSLRQNVILISKNHLYVEVIFNKFSTNITYGFRKFRRAQRAKQIITLKKYPYLSHAHRSNFLNSVKNSTFIKFVENAFNIRYFLICHRNNYRKSISLLQSNCILYSPNSITIRNFKLLNFLFCLHLKYAIVNTFKFYYDSIFW